jgi:hypothetical protein
MLLRTGSYAYRVRRRRLSVFVVAHDDLTEAEVRDGLFLTVAC